MKGRVGATMPYPTASTNMVIAREIPDASPPRALSFVPSLKGEAPP
jgi:hypothetical protein